MSLSDIKTIIKYLFPLCFSLGIINEFFKSRFKTFLVNTLILPLWHIPWISGSCMYRQLLELHRPNWMKVSKSRLSKQTLHHDIYFRGPGVFISEKYFTSFCLLMRQCSQVGIPLEQRPVYLRNYDFWCSKSTIDCKVFPQTKTRSLWV